MMVEAKLKAMLKSHPSEPVQPSAENVPLGVIHYMLVSSGKDRNICLALYRIALLAYIDAGCPYSGQKIQFFYEFSLNLFVRSGKKK